jgi:hypothetical protein
MAECAGPTAQFWAPESLYLREDRHADLRTAPFRALYEAFALQVLTIDESAWLIKEVTTFLNPDLFPAFGQASEASM